MVRSHQTTAVLLSQPNSINPTVRATIHPSNRQLAQDTIRRNASSATAMPPASPARSSSIGLVASRTVATPSLPTCSSAVVAAAAYRSAEKLENARDGFVHDFSRRSGVEHAEIVLPAGADAEWARDRSALWNAAEALEKRKDARVAREIEVALPHELSAEQRLELTREFAQSLADR